MSSPADPPNSPTTSPADTGAVVQATLTAVQEFIGPRLEAATDLSDDAPPRLIAAMRHALLAPGKRLRPALALEAARICGGTWEQAAPAAIAVEMIDRKSVV